MQDEVDSSGGVSRSSGERGWDVGVDGVFFRGDFRKKGGSKLHGCGVRSVDKLSI